MRRRPLPARVAVTVAAVGAALAACGPPADGPVVSSCSATLDGNELGAAVVAIDAGATSELEVRSPVPVDDVTVSLALGPLRIPLADEQLPTAARRVTVAVPFERVAFVAVGRQDLVVTVGTGCEVRAPVRLDGRHVLSTLVGALGAVALVLGAAGVVAARRRRRRETDGEPSTSVDVEGAAVRAAGFGALAGVGSALVLQGAGLVGLGWWAVAIAVTPAVGGAVWVSRRS